MKQADVVILGAGSYGTALAICFARKGIATTLWGRDADKVAIMQAAHENEEYLPACPFPESLSVTADLSEALHDVKNVVVVVPSHSFSSMLEQAKPLLAKHARVAWATKGLEPDTGRLLYEVAEDIHMDEDKSIDYEARENEMELFLYTDKNGINYMQLYRDKKLK